MGRIVCIDIEATGLNTKLDKIIEIGAVEIINDSIGSTFSTLINPGRRLDDHIVDITGIKDSDLITAPAFKAIAKELTTFIGDAPLLGHNIMMDYAYLKHAFVNDGYPFEKYGLDTLKISRSLLLNVKSKKLKDLCDYFNIALVPHRALNDAIATSQLYLKLKNDFKSENPALFEPFPLKANVKKQVPILKSQKEHLVTIIERNKIDCPYDLDKMSRNEASRYYDLLLAKGYK